MVSLNQAAHLVTQLSRQVTSEPTADSNRNAANILGSVARALEDLDYRLEAQDLVISTLAKKAGLTESQIHRQQLPSGSGASQNHRYDSVSEYVRQILQLADK